MNHASALERLNREIRILAALFVLASVVFVTSVICPGLFVGHSAAETRIPDTVPILISAPTVGVPPILLGIFAALVGLSLLRQVARRKGHITKD